MSEPTSLAEAWGQVIQRQRERVRKQSRQELADELGVSRQTIWFWENGKYVPSGEWQTVLVQKLGIDPKALHDIYKKAARDETVA